MRAYQKLAINRRVVVNLTNGDAIGGVLLKDRGPLIVLGDAQLHTSGGTAPMDGEVLIERDRIAFTQVVS